MAKDMDFSARRRPAPSSRMTPAVVPSSPKPAAPPIRPPRNSSGAWLAWLVIVLILAVGVFALWQYFRPSTVSQKTTPTTSSGLSTDQNSTTPASNNLVATKNSLPRIQVYDSGAGSEAVAAVTSNLKALGYPTEDLAKSQFNYDKTYIWYQAGLETEAAKIRSTMPDRLTELKETKIAGTFDILVLLGTK